MSNVSDSCISIQIYGYCGVTSEQIKYTILGGRVDTLCGLTGEYTIVYKTKSEIGIVTSSIGAIHYFYYFDGLKFCHGNEVVDILNQANIPWAWDWESLGDLCDLENLTENRTLHPMIKRVPPGSVLRFRDKLLLRSSSLLSSLTITNANAVDAIDIFNAETKRWTTQNPYLSLSGGFDSRVILSSMLKQNIYPTIVTLGNDNCSDMRVASQIAEKFQLDHVRVQLTPEDLLDNAERIAKITNGSKPACHWHTYLYPKKAKVPIDQSFFVGTLGEFARSYYFDRGFVSLLADGFPGYLQKRFWMMKLSRHRTFKESELEQLCDPFRLQVSKAGIKKRAWRNAKLSSGEFLSGGTRYYLEQRVPNFYANGIRMYNDTSQWRSPFHNIEWLKVIWGLHDSWKLGSNWHRLAISRNYPALLEFAEEKGLCKNRMLAKAPPLYWLKVMQRQKYETYDLSKFWYSSKILQSLILDNQTYVDDILDRRLTESILKEHTECKNRTKAISFLLTLIFFKKALGRKS